MKPALHRSVIFWSGILVIAFTCWAWRDSQRFSLNVDNGIWCFSQDQSAVSIWRPDTIMPRDLTVERGAPDRAFRTEIFPAPLFMRGGDQRFSDEEWQRDRNSRPSVREDIIRVWRKSQPSALILYLPYWLLLCAFTVAWAALLLWRAKRRKGGVAADEQEDCTVSP